MSALPLDIVERFRHELKRLGVARSAGPVLAAVSGGSDSLALLLLLHAELGDLCRAATVDHGLRPASADEARYVAEICGQRSIPHVILSGPMPRRSGRTANISARSRELRYALLEQHRQDSGCGWIATAHHADDQLETMVMRLNRGSGVAGLAGIRERQGRIVRPLIAWRQSTLEDIVGSAGLIAVDDPTNRDERYDRARLRKILAGVDWLDRERIAYCAHNLAAADEALEWAADDLFARQCTVSDGTVSYLFRAVPKELHRRLVKRCITHIDPRADCGKAAISRVLIDLYEGRKTMIGEVLCTVTRHTHESGRPMAYWHFRPAPPRRAT